MDNILYLGNYYYYKSDIVVCLHVFIFFV